MVNTTINLSVGVCVPDSPPPNSPRTTSYSHYIHEILAHAGVAYRGIESASLLAELPRLRVLVTVGEAAWGDDIMAALEAWVQGGGAWLAIGGVCGRPDLFGVEYRKPAYVGAAWGGQTHTLGEGYLEVLAAGHPTLAGVPLPLHYFNGIAVVPGSGAVLARTIDAHQRANDYVAVAEHAVGAGRCFLIAPDAVGTVVRIQQGVAVTRDGVPAADGTGSVSDGTLKCDDGAVLDWSFDRQEVCGAPGLRCFLEPIADHWRGVILRAIFHLCVEQNVVLPVLWLYPRNLPALAHLSHDSDNNVPALAHQLLEVTREAQVPATWCVILPGYEPTLIQAIKNEGHELATHYDALDHPWGEDEFDAQWRALCEQFDERPVSNKNHYTRWEGDTEFFDWCARRGIELEQTKGPSKFGEAGFTFGSCHPYFPVAPDGRLIDVLELPLHTQDLEIFVPAAVTGPFIDGAVRVHGIVHLLFHPNHIAKNGVAESLTAAVAAARAAGMEWWTAARINAWERARRSVTWKSGDTFSLRAAKELPEATLLILNGAAKDVCINGAPCSVETTVRWGFEFSAVTIDVAGGVDYSVRCD